MAPNENEFDTPVGLLPEQNQVCNLLLNPLLVLILSLLFLSNKWKELVCSPTTLLPLIRHPTPEWLLPPALCGNCSDGVPDDVCVLLYVKCMLLLALWPLTLLTRPCLNPSAPLTFVTSNALDFSITFFVFFFPQAPLQATLIPPTL